MIYTMGYYCQKVEGLKLAAECRTPSLLAAKEQTVYHSPEWALVADNFVESMSALKVYNLSPWLLGKDTSGALCFQERGPNLHIFRGALLNLSRTKRLDSLKSKVSI